MVLREDNVQSRLPYTKEIDEKTENEKKREFLIITLVVIASSLTGLLYLYLTFHLKFEEAILLFCFFLLIVSMPFFDFRFRYSAGNVTDYDLKKFNLLWSDTRWSEKKESVMTSKEATKRILLLGIGVITSITVSYITFYTPLLKNFFELKGTSVDALAFLFFGILIYAILFSPLFFLLFLSITYIKFVMSRNLKSGRIPSSNLRVYSEGIGYLNYIIPWENVDSINYPKLFTLSSIAAPMAESHIASWPQGTTVKILDKEGKVYLPQVLDVDGFEEALRKTGQHIQPSLLKKL